jgi:hypothetical protein
MTNQTPPSNPKTRHPKLKTAGRPAPAPATAPQDRRDLQVEIDNLRYAIDCNSQRIDEDGPLSEQLRLLDGLSSASMRLASLLKIQKTLTQGSDDYLAGLNRMLEEAYEKLHREGVPRDE